jgi:arylsulfate sulfotransferase
MPMKRPSYAFYSLWLLSCLPACAAVQIVSFQASPAAPQPIGTSITWTVTATDSNRGLLTFQFSVAPPGGAMAVVSQYNAGTYSGGVWTSRPFVWMPTGIEGAYQVQVSIKDFTSGEGTSETSSFQVNPLVTGSRPVAVATANPLVALFSAPSCPAGSAMRVLFGPQSGKAAQFFTNWMACHPPNTMTFEVAGMYASTAYFMRPQIMTGGKITNGAVVPFTTGPLPANIPFPPVTVKTPAGPNTDTTDSVVLFNLVSYGATVSYPAVATDLSGNILWYYYASDSAHYILLTRPLPGGNMLTIQNGPAWNPVSQHQQLLREIDLAGNVIHETNTGALQQQLRGLGAADAQPCTAIPSPPPVGAGCLNAFHHDAIQSLPNGYTAAFLSVEKIFPPGTQGDTSGLPVDILGDLIVVLDNNWRAVWYFDAFEHDSGAPQLDINRAAVLGATCSQNEQGCPPIFLLGPGVAPFAHDWLHGNSLYYWPQSHDLLWSSKNQDWVMKIDFNGGHGTGNILWRLGPCGDFTFNNTNSDPWPWFSAQHEVAMENNGAGPLTVFDNGDTRVSPPSGPGSSSGCLPGLGSGHSRGMALAVDENTFQVTPVLSQDLGVFTTAGGSAQLLSNGNYFFLPAVVFVSLSEEASFAMQFFPTPGTVNGAQVLNLQAPSAYRGWQMPSLYNPPGT